MTATATRNPTEEDRAAAWARNNADNAAIAQAIQEGLEGSGATLSKLELIVIDSEVTRLLDHTPYGSGAGTLTEADLTLAQNWARSLAFDGLRRRLAVAWFVEQLLVDHEPVTNGPTGKTVNDFMRHLLYVAAASYDGSMGEAIREELDRP